MPRARRSQRRLTSTKPPSLTFEAAWRIFEAAHLANKRKRTAEENRALIAAEFPATLSGIIRSARSARTSSPPFWTSSPPSSATALRRSGSSSISPSAAATSPTVRLRASRRRRQASEIACSRPTSSRSSGTATQRLGSVRKALPAPHLHWPTGKTNQLTARRYESATARFSSPLS